MKPSTLTACAILALSAGPVLAQAQQTQQTQQQTQQQQTQQQPQVAGECLADLQELAVRMEEEGYWLTGWRGYGVGPRGVPPATAVPPPGGVTADDRAAARAQLERGEQAAQEEDAERPAMVPAPGRYDGPWGNIAWTTSPRREILALYNAANVLARRGEAETCQAVVAQLEEIYGEYVTRLREAGVDPEEVVGWRAEQIAMAVPVEEFEGTLRLDDVIGTDVRNTRDEQLGEIADIIVDPSTGRFAYAIIEHGGFLGIGGEQVAALWDRLKATPGLNTFVLDVREEAVENAPQIEADALRDEATFEEYGQEIENYWDRAIAD